MRLFYDQNVVLREEWKIEKSSKQHIYIEKGKSTYI